MAQFDVRCDRCGEEGSARRMDLKEGVCFYCREEERTIFKETDEVGFDSDGFAVHKKCGTRLSEWWSIVRDEVFNLKRDGTTVLVSDDGDDSKECDGVTCDECDVQVVMEKA